MPSDTDPTLETDHLDELLEKPAPVQPVVVVEYRDRGVPSWIFFPLILLVPLVALVAYHRLYVERYRVQAARDQALLAHQIEAERANQPLVRDTRPSTAVLPIPKPAANAAAPSAGGLSASPSSPAAAATPVVERETKVAADPDGPKSDAQVASSPSPSPAAAGDPPSAIAAGFAGQTGPLPDATGPADTPDVGPAVPGHEKAAKLTMRTVLPNPFADGATPPKPPAPNDGTASTKIDGGKAEKPLAGARAGLANQAVTGSVPDERFGPEPLAPLPTKEESDREIQEEAARKAAEIAARYQNRDADLRARRMEEQLKFREELREVLRLKDNLAGLEIANLEKRYGYEIDKDIYDRAARVWKHSRTTPWAKVRFLRSIDIPETTILVFMCGSIHNAIGTRGGPRDENEVRVRAARQLLSYELVGAGAGAPRARKTVISAPR